MLKRSVKAHEYSFEKQPVNRCVWRGEGANPASKKYIIPFIKGCAEGERQRLSGGNKKTAKKK